MKKKEIKDAVINFRITTAQKEKINYDAQKVGLNVTEYLSAMAEDGRIIQVVKGKELIGMIYDINNDINELERCPIFSYQMIREVITNRLNSTLENIKKKRGMSKKMSILKFEPRTRRDLYEMCQYLIDPNKTDYRGLLGFGVNPLQAAKEMEFTQLMYHKEKMWHPYLQIIFSFDWGMEIPVDSARMICIEIGKALLPDRRQCLGAIHFKKTNHIHCHYLVNNISIDGELAYTQYHYILEYYDKINAILKKYGMNEISLLYRSRQS